MATIAGIIRTGRGCAGSNGAWRVERDESDPFVGQEYSLWHYSTRMLRWRSSRRSGTELLDYSTGHGSVSDQGGMNTAFRELGLPYRFDRDARGGGPRITELVRNADGYYVHPDALKPRRPRQPSAGGAAVATIEAPAPDESVGVLADAVAICTAAEVAALPFEWLAELAAIRNLPEVR
jgi:hypothetical protein